MLPVQRGQQWWRQLEGALSRPAAAPWPRPRVGMRARRRAVEAGRGAPPTASRHHHHKQPSGTHEGEGEEEVLHFGANADEAALFAVFSGGSR